MAATQQIKKKSFSGSLFQPCRIGRVFFAMLLAWALMPAIAYAAPFTPFTTTTRTTFSFSMLICNMTDEMNGYSTLISAICYVLGAFLGIRGVLYLAQRFGGESDGQGSSTTKGIAHLLGGGALLSAPTLVYILVNSMFPNAVGSASGSGACVHTGVPVALSTSPGLGLDEVMQNFVKDISRPMFTILSALAIVVGLFLIIKALLKGAKYGSDPRSDNVKNIVTNLVIGAILVSIGDILPTVLATLFGTGAPDDITSFAGLNWSALGLPAGSTTAADNSIKAGLAFVQIVGAIAFLRGWLMVKGAVEGTSQQTVPQGITHIIGGAMAINIGTMLKIIDNTFGTGMVL